MTSTSTERLAQMFLARHELVVKCARRYLRTPQQVEDVVQQVFLEFVGHPERWDLDADVSPLLNRITRNIALVHLQEEYRYSSKRVREVMREYIRRREDEPDDDTPLADQLAALNECVERLSEKSRDLIDLHYRRRTTIREIAASLHANENSVGKAVGRIRAALKACIERSRRQSSVDSPRRDLRSPTIDDERQTTDD